MALGAPYYVAVLKSFEAKYGIKVESLDLRASELAEAGPHRAGRGPFSGRCRDHHHHDDRGTAQGRRLHSGRRRHSQRARTLRAPFKATEVSVPAYVQPMGSWSIRAWSSRRTSRKSWEDLNDPKWKGKDLVRRHASAWQRQYACSPSCRKSWALLSTKTGGTEAGFQPRPAQRCAAGGARRIPDLRPADLRSLPPT